ncbi:MAG: hypothetical protein JWQ22_1493 [Devosia sp.]|nr:hypothetical protein [Devosia sp.]
MSTFFLFEASKPDGTTYRFAFALNMHWASWLVSISRLF